MTRRTSPIHKVQRLIKQSITKAVFSMLSICPAICNFKYQAIYR